MSRRSIRLLRSVLGVLGMFPGSSHPAILGELRGNEPWGAVWLFPQPAVKGRS